jgi:hypothetical protein
MAFGNSLQFDGSVEYGYAADKSILSFTDRRFAINCEIKIISEPAPGGLDWILIKGNSGVSGNWEYGLYLYKDPGSGNLRIRGSVFALGGSGKAVGADLNYSLDTWYNISFEGDGSDAYLYIDTVLNDSADITSVTMGNGSSRLDIGRRNGAGYFHGELDHLFMRSEELNANKRADIYNGGVRYHLDITNNWPTDGGSIGDGAVNLTHFNESSGITAFDSSGNSTDFTLVNMDNSNWQIGGGIVPLPTAGVVVFRRRMEGK